MRKFEWIDKSDWSNGDGRGAGEGDNLRIGDGDGSIGGFCYTPAGGYGTGDLSPKLWEV